MLLARRSAHGRRGRYATGPGHAHVRRASAHRAADSASSGRPRVTPIFRRLLRSQGGGGSSAPSTPHSRVVRCAPCTVQLVRCSHDESRLVSEASGPDRQSVLRPAAMRLLPQSLCRGPANPCNQTCSSVTVCNRMARVAFRVALERALSSLGAARRTSLPGLAPIHAARLLFLPHATDPAAPHCDDAREHGADR